MSKHSLQGKVVVIAGGGKNLGGLIARDFAERGVAGITVHYNRDSSRVDSEATVAAVEKAGAKACLVQADLTKVSECTRLFEETAGKLGTADIAINTAGNVPGFSGRTTKLSLSKSLNFTPNSGNPTFLAS